jgi:hypothetical protein
VTDRHPPPGGPDPYLDLISGEATCEPLRYTLHRDLAYQVRWDPDLSIRQDLDFVFRAARHASCYCVVAEASGYVRDHDGARVSRAAEYLGARAHLWLLMREARDLAEREPDPARVRALQLGLWRLLHMLYVQDPVASRRGWAVIRELDGEETFMPPRRSRVLRVLDGLLGPRVTDELLRWPRQAKRAWARATPGSFSARLW